MPTLLDQTHSPDPRVRRRALLDLCPCHVKEDIESVWARILEMVDDPDASVRSLVLHNLCDGSPKRILPEVIESVERLARDPEKKIARRARGALASYRRCGRINVM